MFFWIFNIFMIFSLYIFPTHTSPKNDFGKKMISQNFIANLSNWVCNSGWEYQVTPKKYIFLGLASSSCWKSRGRVLYLTDQIFKYLCRSGKSGLASPLFEESWFQFSQTMLSTITQDTEKMRGWLDFSIAHQHCLIKIFM